MIFPFFLSIPYDNYFLEQNSLLNHTWPIHLWKQDTYTHSQWWIVCASSLLQSVLQQSLWDIDELWSMNNSQGHILVPWIFSLSVCYRSPPWCFPSFFMFISLIHLAFSLLCYIHFLTSESINKLVWINLKVTSALLYTCAPICIMNKAAGIISSCFWKRLFNKKAMS